MASLEQPIVTALIINVFVCLACYVGGALTENELALTAGAVGLIASVVGIVLFCIYYECSVF